MASQEVEKNQFSVAFPLAADVPGYSPRGANFNLPSCCLPIGHVQVGKTIRRRRIASLQECDQLVALIEKGRERIALRSGEP